MYSGFRDTEANSNNITNINSRINVFSYLSNETNPRFVAITVLELSHIIPIKILKKYPC